MHTDSLNLMRELLAAHGTNGNGRRMYDVGSQDINGTYRSLVEAHGWNYTGLDIEPAKNVDVVISENGPWVLGGVDLVISGQCLEHTKWPWKWAENVASLLNPGGTLILIAPSMWPQHRYPVDCWRVLPDGMRALAKWIGLLCIESELRWPKEFRDNHEDCYAVMQKT